MYSLPMSFETIDPSAANDRVSSSEWQYVDVRTQQEFDVGHPDGAFNVPILFLDATGMMAPNGAFIEVMEKHFPKGAKLVLGCKMGGRSMRACQLLAQAGYAHLANMHGGFSGAEDMRGWKDQGFPVASQPLEGRDYRSLSD